MKEHQPHFYSHRKRGGFNFLMAFLVPPSCSFKFQWASNWVTYHERKSRLIIIFAWENWIFKKIIFIQKNIFSKKSLIEPFMLIQAWEIKTNFFFWREIKKRRYQIFYLLVLRLDLLIDMFDGLLIFQDPGIENSKKKLSRLQCFLWTRASLIFC